MRLIDADALINDLNSKGIEFNAEINRIIMVQPSYKPKKYRTISREVGNRLTYYFNTQKSDKEIRDILLGLYYDPYIDVIYCQYRDGMTLEAIANHMRKDVTTIKRNKKRLILEIYEKLKTAGG